ncbi:nicotinate phosphoribosyltransferase [Williamsoniiplasma luminosum]|uniref:nicotinate phosphoribosyltransferase n=1 Tax=Williamsoniiplasma luminosum TaxID=214888 RepID=A0A2K8NTH3_9MOLU|nr:nicotinate phosphoribosyltransferase [Williamsoniiplasma luminosum]ATZ17054.1 nicotinate phosphoribosyltransferase [Williamsoniiplasma luminosum]
MKLINNFEFDPRIKDGYYLADYFKKTVSILDTFKPDQVVTMQWFQRKENIMLCGIQETLALIKFASPNYKNLKIWTLNDGDFISPLEPVLRIEGKYKDFGWLEGMIDGILSRDSSIATNFYEINQAANNKTVLNMNDRADLYKNQQSDGYAAYIAGCKFFVSDASIEYFKDDKSIARPSGTMPHALIQSFDGNTLEATIAFAKVFPQTNLVSLVDYNNDCVTQALEVANHFGEKLYAIRLDTAGNLIDETLAKKKDQFPIDANLYGVNQFLVKEVRNALDQAGHQNVKIIVSSGFDAHKIAEFEKAQIPVDIYGVGEAITKKRTSFTGDAVLIDGVKEAKVGRTYTDSQKLKVYKF